MLAFSDTYGALIGLVILVLVIVPYWKLWSRSGHSGWWSLLSIIPIVNIVMTWVLAFKRWPAEDARAGVEVRG